MAERHNRLGKGLNSIFGNPVKIEKKPEEKKAVDKEEESIAVKDNKDKRELPEFLESSEDIYEKTIGKAIGISRENASRSTTVHTPASALDAKGEPEGKPKLLRINLIQPNLNQPRKDFSEEALEELAKSIKIYGIIQPILVKKQGALYEIIAGERRWRAAKKAGLQEVPVVISDMDEKTSREVAIIENIQRSDLNAVEEALAYQSLISEYGLTQEELSERLSRSRSAITNSLRLLKLSPEGLSALREGKISPGHGRALLSVENLQKREELLGRCLRDSLSVRELERLAKSEGKAKEKKEKGKKESEELKRLQVIYRDLEQKMKQNLGTKVSIHPKNEKRGRLEIEYYSQEELDHIFLLLNASEKK